MLTFDLSFSLGASNQWRRAILFLSYFSLQRENVRRKKGFEKKKKMQELQISYQLKKGDSREWETLAIT